VEAGKVGHIGLSEPGPQTIRRAHVVPIPGTRHVEYLRQNAGAVGVTLDSGHLERLDAIAPKVAVERSVRPQNVGTEAPPLGAVVTS
jgi:aryl-alcohol dehydrogenase-like predicted oxidoreductase